MDIQLRKYYLINILIPVSLFLLIELAGLLVPGFRPSPHTNCRVLAIVIFIGCATSGLSLTIFYRAYFANRHRIRKSISIAEYVKFEKKLMSLSLLPVYFALLGVLYRIPEFYQYFSILIALYAAYYYYPSEKRLDMDRRVFRVVEK